MALYEPLVALVEESPDWHLDALCLEYPAVNFFPGRGEDLGPAKAICARCLVQAECLAYALEHDWAANEAGVWGGASPQERRRLRARAA